MGKGACRGLDQSAEAKAGTEGWYGKLKNARELTQRAMDSALRNDAKETAASYRIEAALREVESGNREQTRAEANVALKAAPNRDVRAMAALTLAWAGDTTGAEKLPADLEKAFPLDTRTHLSKGLITHYPSSGCLAAKRPESGSRTVEGSECV